MTKSAQLYDFASRQRFNKRGARQQAAAALQEAINSIPTQAVSVRYHTEYGTINQQLVPNYSVSIFASVSLHKTPTTGSLLLDCINRAMGLNERYEVLFRIVEDTNAGRNARLRLRYCSTPAEVMREIDDERKYIYGKGQLYFDNYTGEPSDLFRKLSWLAAN